MNKKAFSFVELIISITILVLLAIIWTAATNNIKNNSNNSRVIADLNTLKNSLITYSAEWNSLPKPHWNRNYFKSDWSYIHDFEDEETFWWFGKITENTLENRYLNTIPLDPRTNQYYSYWVAKNQNEFEIAWVLYNDWQYLAKVEWNYRAESWIFSLIREYNWSNYVIDKSYNLPYNPYERTLIATASDWSIYEEWDTITNNSSTDLEIYFSDWSVSIITPGTTIRLTKLDFPKENNLVSNVLLFLETWTIWTQATRLWEESTFDIFTVDTTASVRWTVFKVSKNSWDTNTDVLVIKWIVDVKRNININQNNIYSKKDIYKDIYNIINNSEISSIELNTNDSENIGKKLNITNSDTTIGSINTIDIELSEVEKPNFPKLNLTDKLEENQISFNEIINEKTWNKSCYLEWVEVKNWEVKRWYKERFVESFSTCSTPQDRVCENWVFTDLFTNYKYISCVVREPWQCTPYSEDWFYWHSAINQWDTINIIKSEYIYLWWNRIWTKNINRTLKCIDGINYEQVWIDHLESVTCNSPFTQIWETCSCPADHDLYWWTCYENPFGPDYVLVKVVNEINSSTRSWTNNNTWYNSDYYWLKQSNVWVYLWSNFWLVFDTNWVSQDPTQINYLYNFDWNKNIVYSKGQKIKLSTDWDIISNIIKYSNDLIDIPKTIKLRFDWTTWEDLSGIINDNRFVSWSPINLDSQKLKLINVSNIRIYNKDTSWTWWAPLGGAPSWWEPIASWWISVSWHWCWDCPSGSIKKWSWCWHYRVCDWVIWSNVCAEKSWCFRGDESWSWTYYP